MCLSTVCGSEGWWATLTTHTGPQETLGVRQKGHQAFSESRAKSGTKITDLKSHSRFWQSLAKEKLVSAWSTGLSLLVTTEGSNTVLLEVGRGAQTVVT